MQHVALPCLSGLTAAGEFLSAGTILAGIVGAILSVPIAAVIWSAIKSWTGEEDGPITPDDIVWAERETKADAVGRGRSSRPGRKLAPSAPGR